MKFLPEVFLSALRRLNPQIDDETLKIILQDFREYYSTTDLGLEKEALEIHDLRRSERKLTKEEEQKL